MIDTHTMSVNSVSGSACRKWAQYAAHKILDVALNTVNLFPSVCSRHRLWYVGILFYGQTFSSKSIYLLGGSFRWTLSDIQLQFHGAAKVVDILCLPHHAKDAKISQLSVAGSTSAFCLKAPRIFFELAGEND